MDAYTLALSWLARRELTERQVRARLSRRRVAAEEIDAAVERLRRERALDDRRVAGAYARTAVRLKGRGPLRLRRDLQALGVDAAAAREAIDEALAETPEETLIDRVALDRALASAIGRRASIALFAQLARRASQPTARTSACATA